MEALLPFLIFGCVIAFVGIAMLLSHLNAKKRTESMRQISAEMGLDFQAEGDAALQDRLSVFQLMNQGRARKSRNLIVAATDELRIALFDYQFTKGSGKNSHTYHQSVAALESTLLTHPPFALRPEGFWQRLVTVFGGQDIDFDSHPEFSKMFALTSSSEDAVREFFDDSILEFFESQPQLCIEAAPGLLILYSNAKRVKPDELRSFLELAYQTYGLFVDRCATLS